VETDVRLKMADGEYFTFKKFVSLWRGTLIAALKMHAFKHARIRRQDAIRKLGPTKKKDSTLSEDELREAQIEAQETHINGHYANGVYEFLADEAQTIAAPKTDREIDAELATLLRLAAERGIDISKYQK
jgi:hypothetical protein